MNKVRKTVFSQNRLFNLEITLLYMKGNTTMFDEKDLDFLREKVKNRLSEYRFSHTLGVEMMAVRLGKLLAPDKIPILRAAALLHDITKENSFENQLQICENVGIILSYVQKMTPKTLHAVSAVALIPSEFPEFADDEILSAVRSHTTGNENMSLTDEIIYLSDYIEENRTFEDCVTLRNFFFAARPEGMARDKLLFHFKKTLLLSFDMTMHGLLNENAPIDTATVAARNSLIFYVKNYAYNG